MKPRFLIILATVIEFAIGASAYAQTSETRSVVVSYDDLNIRSARGRLALDRRLVRAAYDACSGTSGGVVELTTHMQQAACVRRALIDARADMQARVATQLASR